MTFLHIWAHKHRRLARSNNQGDNKQKSSAVNRLPQNQYGRVKSAAQMTSQAQIIHLSLNISKSTFFLGGGRGEIQAHLVEDLRHFEIKSGVFNYFFQGGTIPLIKGTGAGSNLDVGQRTWLSPGCVDRVLFRMWKLTSSMIFDV